MADQRTQRVMVDNSGLVIFVYDEANADRIRAAGPEILDGFSEEVAEEEALQRLASEGALVVYEIQQDDPRMVEVRLGSPPSGQELGDPSWWLPERRARLSLPSGKLCIEGYDFLRLSDEWEFQVKNHRERHGGEPEYGGAVLDLPAGEYVLAIRLRDVMSDYDGEADLPSEIFTLTPAAEAEPAEDLEGILLIS